MAHSYSRDKLDTLVDFPLTGLDMAPYLLPKVRVYCAHSSEVGGCGLDMGPYLLPRVRGVGGCGLGS